MDYNEMLELWGKKVFEKADKAMKSYEESEEHDFNSGYQKGFSDGLRMATAILSKYEKKLIKKQKI